MGEGEGKAVHVALLNCHWGWKRWENPNGSRGFEHMTVSNAFPRTRSFIIKLVVWNCCLSKYFQHSRQYNSPHQRPLRQCSLFLCGLFHAAVCIYIMQHGTTRSVMILRGFGRNRPWPNQGTKPTFARSDWVKPRETSVRITDAWPRFRHVSPFGGAVCSGKITPNVLSCPCDIRLLRNVSAFLSEYRRSHLRRS